MHREIHLTAPKPDFWKIGEKKDTDRKTLRGAEGEKNQTIMSFGESPHRMRLIFRDAKPGSY